MDAKALLNALISYAMDQREDTPAPGWDLLIHAVSVVRDLPHGEASEWLAEEVQDRWIERAD